MHWSSKHSRPKVQYQHQKLQTKKASDKHKHCTMQSFDTALGEHMEARLLNGGCSPRFPLRS